MADLDSLMQGFINTFINKATSAIAKANVGGTGGVGGGITPGAALAGAAAASATSSMTAQFPPLQAASNLALATARTTLFGGAGTTAGAEAMQRALSAAGTVNSPLDAAMAIQRLQSAGLGRLQPSAATVSNLLPGLGETGAAQTLMAMQQPQTVNMARLIGIRLRDANGMPNQINDVINQIWEQMVRVNGGTPPSKEDLQFSLMPGNATYSMITNYFGNDEFLKQAIVSGLFAKASGAKNLSKKELLRVGVTTPEVLAQSTRRTQSLANLQSISGGMLAGAEFGQAAGGAMTAFVTALNNAIPVLSALAGLGAAGSTFNVGYATGGRPEVNRPAIVGERGPEVFIPKVPGYIVPNHMLPQGNGNSWPAFMDGGGEINQQIARSFFSKAGLPDAAVQGILGNLQAESGFRPRAGGDVQDGKYTSFGLAQWHKGRAELLNAFASRRKLNPNNLMTQLKFVAHELKRYGYWSDMSKMSDPYKATEYFMKNFERPADTSEEAIRHRYQLGIQAWAGELQTKGSSGKLTLAQIVSGAANYKDYQHGTSKATGTNPGSDAISSNIYNPTLSDVSMFATAREVIDSMRAQPVLGNLGIKAPVIGTRASGGHVSPGSRYLVGEHGAEGFVPTSGGGGINYGGVTIHIHEVPAHINEETLVKELQRALDVTNIHRRAASE